MSPKSKEILTVFLEAIEVSLCIQGVLSFFSAESFALRLRIEQEVELDPFSVEAIIFVRFASLLALEFDLMLELELVQVIYAVDDIRSVGFDKLLAEVSE